MLATDAERVLGRAVERYGLTGRGFDRALKVARTIADLDASSRIEAPHLMEALAFRGQGEVFGETGVA
jgi:magnesium chelatase family protein